MQDYWESQCVEHSIAVADTKSMLIDRFGFVEQDFWDLGTLVPSTKDWFYDGDHVNSQGAKLLSEHLNLRIEERLARGLVF